VDDDFDSDAWKGGTYAASAADRTQQHVWGLRYVDDAVLHRIDANGDGDYVDGGDGTWYHLTDAQFSTVCLVDDEGAVAERVSYSAYGIARHHWKGDVDGDGAVTVSGGSSDLGLVAAASGSSIGGSGYRSEYDLDRDGDVDAADQALVGSAAAGLPSGQLSPVNPADPDSQAGWDGYLYAAETGLYEVRFRAYSPELGRWMERDPANYLGGLNLLQYTISDPTRMDPTGLDSGLQTFVGPTALLVSWINPFTAADLQAGVASVTAAYYERFDTMNQTTQAIIIGGVNILADSANTPPPLSFTPTSFIAWNASAEHRGWLKLDPDIQCCDGSIKKRFVQGSHSAGATPTPGLGVGLSRVYDPAEFGPVKWQEHWDSDLSTGKARTCVTWTLQDSARVGTLGNLAQRLLLSGVSAPFISREIEYKMCCDGYVKIDYRGSYFPSHRAYQGQAGNLTSVGARLQDASRLGEFVWSPTTVIPPTHITTWIGSAQEVGPDGTPKN
jgi:RHS repeat-associated protein